MRKAVIAAILFLPVCLPTKSSRAYSVGYSQAIQLERGWNLVSWYIVPPDPTPILTPLRMDDLFDRDDLPWGPQNWFDSDQEDITDMVGVYSKNPYYPDYKYYPKFGYDEIEPPELPWNWDQTQAYYIYLDTTRSESHFWEFENQEDYPQTSFPIDPSNDWDLDPANYWYFLAYPLRMQYKVAASPTIAGLANDPGNPLIILKDDDGRFYDPNTERGNLEYLKPGKGYFAGFRWDTRLADDCNGFVAEQSLEPESEPPNPKEENEQTASSAVSHFQYKARTHWWYPIVIDTVDFEQTLMEEGDEIAVFDGDLCVGATVYEGVLPIYLAAWQDDIASPTAVDGYIYGNDMSFVWYDASENAEITFVPPPQTAASVPEADPYFPTHSGFGRGFCAVRSLVDGVQSVKQLPQEYRLGQNYPNPFNPTTVFPLELPQRSRVTIDIFDVSGRLVWTIEAGVCNAGRANVHFNASRLASGVYFYRVTAEGSERGGMYQDVGKMLLLK